MKKLLLLLSIFMFLATRLCFAQEVVVDTSGSGDFLTIQEGIDAAVAGDTVMVRPGTYVENIDFKGKNIYVTSSDGPDSTIIDGSQPQDANIGSVVSFVSGEDNTAVLKGFTITGGTGTLIQTPFPFGAIRVGGGIYCSGASPTIAENVIKDNLAEDGGGMELSGGSATVKYNIIWRNKVATTKTNFFPSGGGIGITTTTAGTEPDIFNNTIVENEAEAPVTSGGGVGVLFAGSVATMRNNIIINNQGAGIFTVEGGQANTTFSDVSQNAPNFVGAACSDGCIDSDPLFVDGANGDFNLQSNSPAIDSGEPGETDPDGTRRDMGALFFDQSVTSVETSESIPSGYALLQNFPNPFNPGTKIRFKLPAAGHVVVTVFNTLGQEIRLLVNKSYSAGDHMVRWDGRDRNGNAVSSGVYLYKLKAGEFQQVKKMSLLR